MEQRCWNNRQKKVGKFGIINNCKISFIEETIMSNNFVNDLEKNYKLKEELVEKLRHLIKNVDHISKKYSDFNEIRRRWFEIGPVPRIKDQILWNNFQHNIKNFYDYLKLNRTFKKIDEEHNFKEKKNIILQAKKLSDSKNLFRSEKLLDRLLKKWKYETRPVSNDNDKLENELKNIIEITKEKIEIFKKNNEIFFKENLQKKVQLLKKMKDVLKVNCKSNSEWKSKINNFETIKNQIQLIGPIKPEENKIFWKDFRKCNKEFYLEKNIFFKDQKRDYKKNIQNQERIINDVKLLTEGNLCVKEKVILLQKEWKKIKPVPFKVNKKNFNIFKSLCDQIFKKISSQKLLENEKTINEIKLKTNYINEIKKLIGEGKLNINETFDGWNNFLTKHVDSERKFFEIMKIYLKAEGLNENEIEIKFFDQKIKRMNDKEKKNEKISLNRKLKEFEKELSIIENNFSFFNDKSKQNILLKKIKMDLCSIKENIISLNLKISKLSN
tara:strand:- start:422 stop:1915 length:1494 start_codon:yes stop_codon:yes gene_type:complete